MERSRCTILVKEGRSLLQDAENEGSAFGKCKHRRWQGGVRERGKGSGGQGGGGKDSRDKEQRRIEEHVGELHRVLDGKKKKSPQDVQEPGGSVC